MGIVRPTMELFPLAWIFFVPFIIVTSFAVLNLFIGIIVDAMAMAQDKPRKQNTQEIKDFTAEEVGQIHDRLDVMQKEMVSLLKIIDKK
jgi:voltage-gated sodium channel